jgi:hypothetical protein
MTMTHTFTDDELGVVIEALRDQAKRALRSATIAIEHRVPGQGAYYKRRAQLATAVADRLEAEGDATEDEDDAEMLDCDGCGDPIHYGPCGWREQLAEDVTS